MDGDRLPRVIKLVERRQKNDGQAPVLFPDHLRCGETGDSGHLDVQDQHVRFLPFPELQDLTAVFRFQDVTVFSAVRVKALYEHLPLDHFIIRDQNL